MTLNRRLLLGISPLLVIFLAVGLYAIYLFTKLGGAIDVSLLAGALAAGFVTATGGIYFLSRSIVQPMQNLTESARQLGEGNLEQHVPVQSEDEVGKLAEAFNKMAARLRAYRQSTTEKILQAQQTTESALRAFPDPIFVFSPAKEIDVGPSIVMWLAS